MNGSLNNELIRSYSRIHKAYNHLVQLDANKLDLTAVQLKTLYRIYFQPDIGIGELATKLSLTKSTVSGIIDRLSQRQLIERTIPEDNRRAVNIQLTEEGHSIMKQYFAGTSTLSKKVKEVMELPEEEINKILELNGKILAILSEIEEEQL
ncbi:MarR family winged helix-turn-helix transcriptional regulator [Niallia sp. Sow4_A1]|jgi:DNA-binding MarR family transcriptional regulator|uniref:MarR family transcriptional regulator n=1 Tax=Niallia hominis TaxID=3133173 RepID=A0ABV1EUM4_9BACI|nr:MULTISPECIES: MarR family transcriptional regulator [Bacillaceae]MCF2650624.1 MarR family transcriptional regulator [Niallia circulans]CAI9394987.1 Transcriptional regulator SlyA [Bacillus sp. T2.9-1]